MTYGWVLLTIIAILGAMVYFDVLNPSILLPERCTLGYRLGCQDFIITPAQIRVSAFNSFPDDMVITSFNFSSSAMQGSCNTSLFPEDNLPLASGQTQTFSMNCAALSNVRESGKVKFSTLTFYYLNASGPIYQFPLYGEIYAKIEK